MRLIVTKFFLSLRIMALNLFLLCSILCICFLLLIQYISSIGGLCAVSISLFFSFMGMFPFLLLLQAKPKVFVGIYVFSSSIIVFLSI